MSAERPPEEVGTTSSSGGATDQESWKVTLPCTKAEAEAIGDAEMEDAVLLVTEEDEAAGRWRLDAYLEREPDAAALTAIRALAPSATAEPLVERLDAQDWVTMSQAGLQPIREGRFVVHTSAFPAEPPEGGRAFLIEAGQAFGTGHHGTTAGCLAMLDALAGEGRRFGSIVDLGTGTGVLAFAAAALWPDAQVTATDNDPIAIEVTARNAVVNGIGTAPNIGQLVLGVADGARGLPVSPGTRFDLVIANILASPLIAMAPEIAAVAAPGAAVLLAGLLATQTDAVVDAYCAAGCTLERAERRGDWTILLLKAGARAAGDAPAGGDRNGWATDM